MSTITTTSQLATSSSLKRLMSTHPLVAYFAIACAGTWLVDLPLLLGKDGLGLFSYRIGDAAMLLVWFSAFTGPFLASFLVTAVTSGKAGIRALLRRYVQWRVGIQWYFVALFGLFLVWLVGLSVLFNGAPLFAFVSHLSLLLSLYLPFSLLFLADGIGEETGWRGFALPRLQAQFGPLLGTTVLALLHGLWHLPLLLVKNGPISGGVFSFAFIVGWMLTVVCVTYWYSWVFNHSRGSLLIAILIHAAGFNAASGLLSALIPTHLSASNWANAILNSPWLNFGNLPIFAILAVLLIVFTRGRLGYRPDRVPQLVEQPQPVETRA